MSSICKPTRLNISINREYSFSQKQAQLALKSYHFKSQAIILSDNPYVIES